MNKLISFLFALICAITTWAQTNVSTDQELRNAIADNANIKLTADIDLSNSTLSIPEGTKVTLDLGGHALDRKLTKRGEGGGQVITVREGATLNLSNGTLKGGWGGAGGALVNEGGMVTLTDVIITNNVADDRGGGICNREGGTLTMTGGVITDNSSNDHSGAKGGGGFFNEENATATLTNVTITGNTAKEKGGGGICNFGTLTLDGCTITGNTAGTQGGGIWQEGTLNMQGMVTISDNKDASGMVDNVYLKSGKVITVTGSLAGNNVGINMETAGVFTSGYNTHNSGVDPATIFTADLTDVMAVSLDANNEAQLTSALLEGDVYYIERSWDNQNDKLIARTSLVYDYQYTLLSNRNYDDDLEISRGTYVVQGNVYVDGYLKINGNTKLILCDGASMKVRKTIIVYPGNNFSVYGQAKDSGILSNDGDESVTDQGSHAGIGTCDGRGISFNFHGGTINVISDSGDGAGIGLHNAHDSGSTSATIPTINIYGGNITATGRSTTGSTGGEGPDRVWGSPGIGGYNNDPDGKIYIYGGYVYADGADAAGIGGGTSGSNHDNELLIIINGGHVIAKAGSSSAGIGGGVNKPGEEVIINGGRVEAYGVGGAGIGSGSGCKNNTGELTVNGGYVYAKGGINSAGIGGGNGSYGQTVTITGGEVHAMGGDDGAGIGGGWCGSGGHLTVTGGTVIAQGGGNGAGIGTGSETINSPDLTGGTFTMTGGHVEAYGGIDAAGIGGGEDADGGTFNISGGYVLAEGKDYGAGIGGGQDGNGGNVTITGGTVIARAGRSEDGGLAIGSGEDGDEYGSLTLGDDRCVYITSNLWRSKKENRISDCKTATCVQISECLHGDATASIVDGEKHDISSCKWCYVTGEEAHTFRDYGECDACHLISLADDADNSETLSHWAEENGIHAVVLSGRTLKKGAWNTLCLPFNVSAFEGSPLEDATVKTLNTTAFDNGTLTMNFSNSSLTSIQAGKPYMVKWGSGDDITNPVFTNVTINNTTSNVESDYVDFCGIYSPVAFTEEDKSVLYLGNDNKLYYPSQAMTINAFRAYFTVDLGGASIKEFKMYFGPEDEETSIDNVQCPMFNVQSENIYNLSGQRLSKPQKGINIINGKKILF